MKDFFTGLLIKFLTWLLDLVGWAPKKVYAELLDGLATIFEAITPPEFMSQAKILLSQWGPIAGYIFDLIQFNWGFSLIVSAVTLKYAISRLPFIGGR